jgi:uncharacterized protein (TIGR00725 family)
MNKQKRKLQIGVMGSASDLGYSSNIEKIAESLGYLIAKSGWILMFGAEKDYDSLSTAACRGAKKAGGMAIGITYGKGLDVYDPNMADAIIATGLERGGGREMSLVLSCDVIICVGGGSGTLTEILVAYQAGIPIVTIKNTGGWSEKIGDGYIDSRNRIKIEAVDSPEKAIDFCLNLK